MHCLRRASLLLPGAGILCALAGPRPAAPAPGPNAAPPIPLTFAAAPEPGRFAAPGLAVTAAGISIALPARASGPARLPASGGSLAIRLEGACPRARARPEGALPGRAGFFLGRDPRRWRSGVPTWERVRFEGVYPGIAAVYYGSGTALEFDFVVAPGADAGRLRLAVEGASRVERDAAGDLHLHTRSGTLRQRRPLLYQEVDGRRRRVDGEYELRGAGPAARVSFRVGAYDRSRPLVIDPVLDYATYLGGSGTELAAGVAVDSEGSAYLTGLTNSFDFPAAGPPVSQPAGAGTVFVTKLSPDGSNLLYSVYLGGADNDLGLAIAVDAAGSAYVTGLTRSLDFPTTPGAFQPEYGGSATGLAGDAFVAKLDPTGSTLLYATYLGGGGDDFGAGIAVDRSPGAPGHAFVAGMTTSPDFPTSVQAFDPTPNGFIDAFVAKVKPGGTGLLYSTYLGGQGADQAAAVAVDEQGRAYVTGSTASVDFPVTPGALAPTPEFGTDPSTRTDAFVARLAASGGALEYCTYLGGLSRSSFPEEFGAGIAAGPGGDAFVAGVTHARDFPTTPGAYQRGARGDADAFVARLSADGSRLVYATYLGGRFSERPFGIAVDGEGRACAAGVTISPDFPAAGVALNRRPGTDPDAFVAWLEPDGGALRYATRFGGSLVDEARAVAIDRDGSGAVRIYAAGFTTSWDLPTARPAQPHPTGSGAAFGVRLLPESVPGRGRLRYRPARLRLRPGTAGRVRLRNAGRGPLSGHVTRLPAPFRVVSGGGDFLLAPGEGREVVVELDAGGYGGIPFSLAVSSDDPRRPVAAVPVAGAGRLR